MPITPFLQNKSFDPEAIEAISSAFAKACAKLGLAPPAHPRRYAD
jgi:hypothetical protein